MGFFERPDPRLAQSADPTPAAAIARTMMRHAGAFGVCAGGILLAYAMNVAIGLRAAPPVAGTVTLSGLREPVTIVRDRRYIPHIRARNDHDLYFAEGYVQGADRLFQLDISRRYAYGRLAEVLGPKALPYDKELRAVDIDAIARRQMRALAPRDRAALVAFTDGINAAATAQPLPVEFRILLYRPAPWTVKDSLAIAIVASLELADSWHDVFARDAIWRQHGPRCFQSFVPLSDARYDVTIDGAPAKRVSKPQPCADEEVAATRKLPAIGSNAWAAGAARSRDGAAILANDPHLDMTIPGIWYLVDIESADVHAAGATIPGLPGVMLGHNQRLAWASTNAAMATTSLFEAGRLDRRSWTTEEFHVRFKRDVRVAYYRTAREFSVPDENDPSKMVLVRWPIYALTRSTIPTALALDRAGGIGEALRSLARYSGSPQNFILADRSGAVAYHVAGMVPNDPAWGRYVHSAHDLRLNYPPLAFDRLPARGPSRDAILDSANNKPYGSAYPYRLSAQFEPPYRAYRIAELLRARTRYDSPYFARMQLDTLSPIDLEIARKAARLAAEDSPEENPPQAVALLARWDGRYRPASRAAALEHALRLAVFEEGPAFNAHLSELRSAGTANSPLGREVAEAVSVLGSEHASAWRDAGAMRIEHLLAPMNFGFLNGAWLPGAGDEYTIHLQDDGIAQGFRAVWDVGDWSRGGISIPNGESGEPGSGHYTDLTPDWISGVLKPMPFDRAAIAANAASVLALQPAQPATGATARHAMVATAQHEATNVGVEILRAGGNAIDAAVAVGYALAVTDPCCGNIGGGGFIVIRLHDGRERFIDFRERAPLRATRTMYLDSHGSVVPFASRRGWLAIAVPGTVAGLEAARREFGTMSRAQLMAPAIALARDGFIFTSGDLLPFTGLRMDGYTGGFEFHHQPNVAAIFLPGGDFPKPGVRFRQSQLAQTLELISRNGEQAFYRGPDAHAIVAASRAGGGTLSLQDFADYRVEEGPPLHCRFNGYEIISAPPPSSGGITLCEILNIIAPYPLARWGWHSLDSLHYVTEAERLAYADRNSYLGDPDFVRNPVAQLLATQYAAALRAKIDPGRATPSVAVRPGLGPPPNEGHNTTHYSIVDRWGDAVSVTYTLNDWFGAGVIAGSTGFFLNDEMDDFTSKPGVANMYGLVQGDANDIEPGKRPLSSMAPTIVTENGKLAMVTGSPGGSRIITIALETILDALVYGMDAQAAVNAPRTHMQWLPDELQYEPNAFPAATSGRLTEMGYKLQYIPQWGSAQAIVVDPKTGVLEGGSDRRTPAGSAEGY